MAITGHEERFRRLYASEAGTRLARMSDALLQLESGGADPAAVEALLREAHTLKGGAGVVGFPDVARVTHAFEEVLERLRDAGLAAAPALMDTLLATVDGLGELIAIAVEGGAADDRADGIVAALAAVEPHADHGAVAEVSGQPTPLGTDDGGNRPPAPASGDGAADAPSIRVDVERLDELVRLVAEAASAHLRVGQVLAERLGGNPMDLDEFRALSTVLADVQDKAMRARMVPVAHITGPLHRAVRDAGRSVGRSVRWEVHGTDTELDRGVLEQLADPLLHLVRNAVAHGLEPEPERAAAGKPQLGTVRVAAAQRGSEVVVTVSDDGRGIDVAAVRASASARGVDVDGMDDQEVLYLVFTSGLSTAGQVTDLSGRGVGLDVVSDVLDRVRGRVEVSSRPGEGTEFRLVVPITLAVLRCVFVACAGRRFALPLHTVVSAQPPEAAATAELVEGRPVLEVGERLVPLSGLAETLGEANVDGARGPVVVVGGGTRLHGFRVDQLLGQRDVVVKGLSPLLPRLEVLAGASVEPDGSVLLVLDPPGLIERARHLEGNAAAATGPPGEPGAGPPRDEDAVARDGRANHPPATVLVVDDSLAVREMQRSILTRAGYRVRVAGDGLEALSILAEGSCDLVVTDVEMPRMDGFAFVEALRTRSGSARIPVVFLTYRGDEDGRRRGMEAGADAYVIKHGFDAARLLDLVGRLLERRP